MAVNAASDHLRLLDDGNSHSNPDSVTLVESQPKLRPVRRLPWAAAAAATSLVLVGTWFIAWQAGIAAPAAEAPVDLVALFAGEKEWGELTRREQKIARSVGYTQQSWTHSSAAIDEMSWSEMTPQQQKALQLLGYTQASWDGGDTPQGHPAGGEPKCPEGGDGVQLTETEPRLLLQRVLNAAGGHPHILVLSCGTREQGARTGRLTEHWARETGNDVEFANYAPFDSKPYASDNAKTVIKNFLSKSVGKGSVIMYSGHGRRADGGWSCQSTRHGPSVLITPSWVQDTVAAAGWETSSPIVVTGSCYGGQWLEYFDGVSGARPDQLNSPAFYNWMFKGGSFPQEAGKYPMCKGI